MGYKTTTNILSAASGIVLPWVLYFLLIVDIPGNLFDPMAREMLLRFFGFYYLFLIIVIKILLKVILFKSKFFFRKMIPESIMVGAILIFLANTLFWIVIVTKGGV
ncbi:MAG: hypothetical protein HQL64_08345 [Magnetococcales bacterium]|nr:hypothetical protein [Magnetococcales bacterium]